MGCKFGRKFRRDGVGDRAVARRIGPCARSRKEWYWRQCVMAAALSFASASLAESATAAPQLASPALAVKAGRQRGLTVMEKRRHKKRRRQIDGCGGGCGCEAHARNRKIQEQEKILSLSVYVGCRCVNHGESGMNLGSMTF